MSSDAIYLVNDSGELQRVEYQFYASEDVLQQLVAKHPELIAGDQIDPDAPPRWLLLRREATIPDSIDGPDRWWLDHLLLDQFGIPTLVEVKRSSDTRIRREVVGQMLDYVANAQAFWAAGRMRQMLADEAGSSEIGDQRLAEHLRLDSKDETFSEQVEHFWNQVEANLREGNVRLLFVADELPRELKRLIEFLNEQFTKVEVLGVELRQYVGQGIKALVPRVIGQTEAAREQKERSSPTRKSGSAANALDRQAFLAAIPSSTAGFFAEVLDQAETRGLLVSWTPKGFNLRPAGKSPFFFCWLPAIYKRESASVEFYFLYFKDPEVIEELRRRTAHLEHTISVGSSTVRLFVAEEALESARKMFEIALDVMTRPTRMTVS
jgi:hypothetical protein